jgi:small subunit ribosomal protein S24e
MEIKIISEKYNPLLKRKEVIFQVEHEQTRGTPPRFEIRNKLAEMLKIDLDRIYVKKLETKTGTMVALGEANAYNSVEQAMFIEPKFVIERNTPKEKEEKPKKPEEKAEKTPKTEEPTKPVEEAEKPSEKTEQPEKNKEKENKEG